MPYEIEPTALSGVLILRPRVFEDARGFFLESFNQREFDDAVGRDVRFVQDNHSGSRKGVLRGLHYQVRQPQAKLVRVVRGEAFDVVVDVRKSSATFGKWTGALLSEQNKKLLWIPEGFAHGFLAMSAWADFLYKTSAYRSPEHERSLLWSDPTVGIDWPLTEQPVVAAKDAAGAVLANAELFP